MPWGDLAQWIQCVWLPYFTICCLVSGYLEPSPIWLAPFFWKLAAHRWLLPVDMKLPYGRAIFLWSWDWKVLALIIIVEMAKRFGYAASYVIIALRWASFKATWLWRWLLQNVTLSTKLAQLSPATSSDFKIMRIWLRNYSKFMPRNMHQPRSCIAHNKWRFYWCHFDVLIMSIWCRFDVSI